MEWVGAAGFADELRKIAVETEQSLYSPALVAHEAAHAAESGKLLPKLHYVGRVVSGSARTGTVAGQLVSTLGGGAPPGPTMPLIGALAAIPGVLDEATVSLKAYRALKARGPVDTKARAQLVAMAGTYAIPPTMDLLAAVLARTRLHPVAQLGTRTIGTWAGSTALSHLARSMKTERVTEDEAKEIVREIAPKGTDLYTSTQVMPGGSAYVPPSRTQLGRELTSRAFSMIMDRADSQRLARKGGILLAPLTSKETGDLHFKRA